LVKYDRNVAFIAGLVYFSQGALVLAGISLPLYLRSLGWSISEIAVSSSIITIPWVIKVLYGFLSDTLPLFGYRRKSYLLACCILGGVGWLGLVFLPAEKFWIIFTLFIANLGFAATDVITDGLVVEHSTESSSPIYQAISWGSRSVGAMISGLIGGWLAAHWEPRQVFLLTALLPLGVLIAVLFIHERKVTGRPFRDAMTPLKKCVRVLMSPNLKWFMLLLCISPVSASFGVPFFFHVKDQLGFHETFLGILTSLGFAGTFLGAVLYGKFLKSVSPRTILRWAVILNCVSILSTFLIIDQTSAIALVFIGGIFGMLLMLPLTTASAILTHHSGVEGSLFAILMSVYNLGQIMFGFIGGKLFDYIGLPPLILGSAVIALGGLWVIGRLDFSVWSSSIASTGAGGGEEPA